MARHGRPLRMPTARSSSAPSEARGRSSTRLRTARPGPRERLPAHLGNPCRHHPAHARRAGNRACFPGGPLRHRRTGPADPGRGRGHPRRLLLPAPAGGRSICPSLSSPGPPSARPGASFPGILKARTGAHEVITSMMLNYVGLNLLTWLLTTGALPGAAAGRGDLEDDCRGRAPSAPLRRLASRERSDSSLRSCSWSGSPGSCSAARSGFRFRMLGLNREAARVAGVNIELHYVLAMTLAGMLVGLGGAFMALGVDYRIAPLYGGTIGFDGITVAILGRGSPLGCRALLAPVRRLHRGRAHHAGQHEHPAPAGPGAPGRARSLRRGSGSHPDHLSDPGRARGGRRVFGGWAG